MDCKELLEMLPEYFCGELDRLDVTRVTTHLLACDACQREATELRKVLGVLARVELPQPGEEFCRNLTERDHRGCQIRFRYRRATGSQGGAGQNSQRRNPRWSRSMLPRLFLPPRPRSWRPSRLLPRQSQPKWWFPSRHPRSNARWNAQYANRAAP